MKSFGTLGLGLVVALCCACGAGAPEGASPSRGSSPVRAPRDVAPAPPEGVQEPVDPSAGIVARARSPRPTLRGVELVVLGVRMSANELRIDVALENTSESSYGLAGDLRARDFRLAEENGDLLAPKSAAGLEPALPAEGLPPGAVRTGELVFPLPESAAVELHLPDFEPLVLDVGLLARSDAPITTSVSPPPPADGPLPARRGPPAASEKIEPLLAAQATALERFDADAYLETFVEERRADERRIFARCRLLPLAEVRMEVQKELPPPGSGRRRTRVEVRFRLDGLAEDNFFFHTLDYTFARAAGAWRVAGIVDGGARPLPWRRGELAVHRTHHFLIYTRPEMRADLVELAADAEAGYAALYQKGLPLDPGYAVYFAEGAEFGLVSGGLPALGVAVARYATAGVRYTVDSRAFYINAAVFSERLRRRLTPERRRLTVTHELAHLALAAQSRPFTPPWLKEGAAVYFSGDLSFDANRRLVRQGMDHLSLTGMTHSHVLGQGGRAADEYLFAGNVVAYLIEQRGQERFLELYRSYADVPPGRGLTHAFGSFGAGVLARVFDSLPGAVASDVTAEALRRHYGLSVAELEAEVKHWLSIPHRSQRES